MFSLHQLFNKSPVPPLVTLFCTSEIHPFSPLPTQNERRLSGCARAVTHNRVRPRARRRPQSPADCWGPRSGPLPALSAGKNSIPASRSVLHRFRNTDAVCVSAPLRSLRQKDHAAFSKPTPHFHSLA